jgi:hypothetical protein
MFIAALFTIAKLWNQPLVPNNQWMDKENVLYIHNGVVVSRKEERNCH